MQNMLNQVFGNNKENRTIPNF